MRIAIASVVCVIVACALCVGAPGVKADSGWYSLHPSSYNSAIYEYTGYNPVPAYGAQVKDDGNLTELYSETDTYFIVKTSDYTNQEYIPLDPPDEFNAMPPPPANATITYVAIIAEFTEVSPTVAFFYTFDGFATVEAQSFGWYTEPAILEVRWEITALENWTAAMLASAEFGVMMLAAPIPGQTYYLDYLGLDYMYTSWEEGGIDVDPDPGGGGANLDYDIIYSAEGIIGILGLIGFVGMIAVPAGGIYIYRHDREEGAITIFVKMLVLFMLCLSFFMLAMIGG